MKLITPEKSIHLFNPEKYMGDSLTCLYRAIPQTIWISDYKYQEARIIDFKVPLSLTNLKNRLKSIPCVNN